MTADVVTEMTRIRKAVERIAESAESYTSADPLTMLQGFAEEQVGGEPQQPFASNGMVHMYALSDGWHIVAREDVNAESGYTVRIERA